MNHIRNKFRTLLLVLIVLLTACASPDQPDATLDNTAVNQDTELTKPTASAPAADTAEPVEMETNSAEANLDIWLQQVKDGQIESGNIGETLDWSLGYFLYYGSLESVAIDTLIYNALLVHRRLATGEVTQETLPQNWQNLLEFTEGLEYVHGTEVIEQIGQTQEIREAILARVTENQQTLSPEEAFASNNVIGFFGPPAPKSIGSKYLVYAQATPDSDFTFLGVIIAVDASTHSSQVTYSIGEWHDLPWLGDAAGPFWEDLPTVSGNSTSTSEGRPGVLLISEATYEEIKAQNLQ